MKFTIVLVVLSVLIALSLAEGEKGEKICKKDHCFAVRCAAPSQCLNRQHMPTGWKFELSRSANPCACCPTCVRVLAEGDACVAEDLANGTHRCDNGLACKDGECSK